MKYVLSIAFTALASCAFAAETPAAADWLVNPSTYKAQVKADGKNLVLDNGLARRVIRLSPGTATTDLQCLVDGEHLLRAVSPEARVTFDGVEYQLGGLSGQKVGNYLKDSWIDELTATEGAYRLSAWKEVPVTERFKWKKRPEWMARDMPWPPPGKHVVLSFLPPAKAKKSEAPVLLEETFGGFRELSKEWTVSLNKAHPRTSFSNEGKVGEIMALPETGVYAEHAWPAGTKSIEVVTDIGDDTTSNWFGPGVALVAEDGEATAFVLSAARKTFSTAIGVNGSFDPAQPVRLRLQLRGTSVICEAAQGDAPYRTVANMEFPKPPVKFRVGKLSGKGQGGGGGKGGEPVRCHIGSVTLRGEEPAETTTKGRLALPEVEVHYELYDGLPVFSKWLEVRNTTAKIVRLNRFVSDELRISENLSDPDATNNLERLWVETDYAFGGSMKPAESNPAVSIGPDKEYGTQVDYNLSTPCLLRCTPAQMGPDADIPVGGVFQSFRTFELLPDSTDRERRTLARRRMYRAIAPWTNENPLMFHKTQSDPKTIREAIDEAAEVGFEMVIMSFGSGFNFESRDRKYWDTYKELADYGRSKGIALGGYSLLASRKAGTPAENTQKQPTRFGVMPCLGAKWGQDYLDNISAFAKYAGIGCFENDGSYPGDRCAATDHPYHHGLDDSQWVQWRAITSQYQALRADGVFLNVPDWYYLAGANKCGMGYRETNWSLPRAEQEIIERQNMFDGTWAKTQTMGWMFVPLSQYHGGGAAATIEPLKEHLPHYEARFANLLGYGVQACWRGPHLYDGDETKALVKKWVTFYKDHREVLDFGDLIHLRRPNGLDWDGILHVNPQGKEKAMAFFYNPLTTDIEQEIQVPLHYAGLAGRALASVDGGKAQIVPLDAAQVATIKVKIPAQGRTWVLFTAE